MVIIIVEIIMIIIPIMVFWDYRPTFARRRQPKNNKPTDFHYKIVLLWVKALRHLTILTNKRAQFNYEQYQHVTNLIKEDGERRLQILRAKYNEKQKDA